MKVPSKPSFPSPTSIMDGKTFPTPGADPGVLPASIDFRPYLVIPDVILPCQEASIHPADSQQGPEDACCQVFVPGPESSQPEQRSQEEAQENSAQNIGLDVPFSWRGCFPGHFRDLGPFGFEIPHIDAPVPICGPYGVQVDIPRLFFPDHFHFPYIIGPTLGAHISSIHGFPFILPVSGVESLHQSFPFFCYVHTYPHADHTNGCIIFGHPSIAQPCIEVEEWYQLEQSEDRPERIGDEAIPELQEPPHKSKNHILPKITFFRKPFSPDDVPCFRTDHRRFDFDD